MAAFGSGIRPARYCSISRRGNSPVAAGRDARGPRRRIGPRNAVRVVFVLLSPSKRIWTLLRRNRRGATTVLGVAIVATATAIGLAATIGEKPVVLVLEFLLAMGWLEIARQLRWPVLSAPAANVWTSAAIALMAVGEGIRLVGVAFSGPLPLAVAAGVDTAAAALFAGGAFRTARYLHRTRALRVDSLSDELARVQELLDRAERERRERLHDARSALFGVAGASALLAEPVTLESLDRPRLGRMIAAELARVQALLATDTVEELVDFDLAVTLDPVLQLHKLTSPELRSSVAAVQVHGSPIATATTLDNLLRNAAIHAPGAAVTVSTLIRGNTVFTVVEDHGPGIPLQERSRVLQAGVRGSSATAPGSGLGLYNALITMSRQGGSLRLSESERGGLRVTMSLPAAQRRDVRLAS